MSSLYADIYACVVRVSCTVDSCYDIIQHSHIGESYT